MGKKVSDNFLEGLGFAGFIADPPVATSLLVLGLIALMLAVLDFSRALG